MKHVHCMSKPAVRSAQSAGEVLGVLGTIFSTLGAIMLTIAPLTSKAR